MKLIFTLISFLYASVLVHAQYITDSFQAINPHEGSIWTAGEQQVITWNPTTAGEGYIYIIKLIVPFQETRYITATGQTAPLSDGKFEWTVDKNLVFSDKAALEIITDKGTYLTNFTFTIEPLPRDRPIVDLSTNASATTVSSAASASSQLGYSSSKPSASSSSNLSLSPQPTTSSGSNTASSANDNTNSLKYTAVFIALFNLCIFLYI